MTDFPLILVKLVLIVGLGAAFVWWQFRDLAREKKRREKLEKLEVLEVPEVPDVPEKRATPNNGPN